MNKDFDAKPAIILLVEDNDGDAFIAQQVFAQSKIANELHIVEDGTDALEFLRKEGRYKDVPTPDMVLLDINLPKLDGKDVLREIKTDSKLKHLPVVMLTSSKSEVDIVKSYDYYANAYMVKPIDMDQFADAIKAFKRFWFSVVVLPDEESVARVHQYSNSDAA